MDKRAKTGGGLVPGRGRRRATADELDAIDLLRAQHRAIDLLFRAIQSAKGASRATSFRELADMLAVHATIEEWIFYPGVRSAETEDLLAESTEEHLAVKRTLAEMVDEDVFGEAFDVKLSLLREQVHHHAIEEEEGKLFPKVRAATDADDRAAMAGAMIALMVELQRNATPAETDEATTLSASRSLA